MATPDDYYIAISKIAAVCVSHLSRISPACHKSRMCHTQKEDDYDEDEDDTMTKKMIIMMMISADLK